MDGWNTILSYWGGLFSGATLVSRRVRKAGNSMGSSWCGYRFGFFNIFNASCFFLSQKRSLHSWKTLVGLMWPLILLGHFGISNLKYPHTNGSIRDLFLPPRSLEVTISTIVKKRLTEIHRAPKRARHMAELPGSCIVSWCNFPVANPRNPNNPGSHCPGLAQKIAAQLPKRVVLTIDQLDRKGWHIFVVTRPTVGVRAIIDLLGCMTCEKVWRGQARKLMTLFSYEIWNYPPPRMPVTTRIVPF